VENGVNLGYCVGNNIGVRNSVGEFVVTLNPDVVLEKDFVSEALKPFKDPGVGVVAPKVLRMHDKKTIDSAGSVFFKNFFPISRGAGEADSGQYDKMEEVFGAVGACAVYRRAMLEGVALELDGRKEYFDEDFFTYFDEVDLQIRSRLMGWTAVYCPQAVARHYWRYSVKRDLIKTYFLYTLTFRNFYLSIIKNASLSQVIRGLPSFALTEASIFLISLMCRRPVFISSKLGALRLAGRMLEKRRSIQKRKRVSDCELNRMMKSNLDYLRLLKGMAESELGGNKLISIKK
ncbi:glycosyltransferase family 2 protein, partial [Candidatus Micrarchaeota archaeon]|nr:glycosyltransferase family 2 protein [Candidatus Micrarchaeota archaeon]